MEITGVVVGGKHVGHTIGFPTANIKPEPLNQPVPENGVYAGEIRIEDEMKWRQCLINHGFQPTIPSGKETIEVYILDFHRDIYAATVALRFTHRLRSEQKFESVEALKEQLNRDVESVRRQ